MKVLITGSGGREHGLAWKIAQSDTVERVYVAPGNAGTARENKVVNIPIDVMDFPSQIRFAGEEGIGLTIIGPEAPLVAGVVDEFRLHGLPCFGPDQEAARLEGSKSYSKEFMKRYGIPTADHGSFTDAGEAIAFARGLSIPVVVKADGLAAGKGVVIAGSHDEAEECIRDMLSGNAFGEAGSRVVIEEFLHGEEASFIVIADGEHFLPFASSQDHKAALDGDRGPNTGGMGACSPAPVVTPEVHDRIVTKVIEPVIAGMRREGHPYTGFLYAGLMIDEQGEPRVIEFNCRFGDPETQPVMMRMRSDLTGLCVAALDQRLDSLEIAFSEDAALTVVLASAGYPGVYETGHIIHGLDDVQQGKVFHAGTRLEGDEIVTSGGRVLGVTALGSGIRQAQARAYEEVKRISFQGMSFRTDIGHRAVNREYKGAV